MFVIYRIIMLYDLIIVSASINPQFVTMTQRAIDSCIAFADVDVILVETSKKQVRYKHVNKTVHYEGQFNYNRALNMGLIHRRGDIQILANNDILFHEGWTRIGDIMKRYGYLSMSAISNDQRQKKFRRGNFVYEGYTIGFELSGWCIFCDNILWDKIGNLDETHRFWYADNAYADQLKRNGIKHGLYTGVLIEHIGSQTLKKMDIKTRKELTYAEVNRYRMYHSKDIPQKI